MDLTFDALDRSINTELKSIYLLYGPEQYLVERSAEKIKKKFGEKVLGINYIMIDDTNTESLISNIEMPAFGYDKKLIIVRNSGLFKKDGRKKVGSPYQELLAEYIKNNMDIINESVVLVFIEETVDKNIIYDQISKNGIISNIVELKPIQLVKKLKQICNLYKVNVEERTLNYLIEVSGTNLQNLINEIRKLISYKCEGGTITIDDVNKLATRQIESVIFDLSDYLATRKIDKAIEILDDFLYQKEPAQKILITLYNHFKKIYLCMIAVKYNKDIVNSLSLKPTQTFLVSKYKMQARSFKLEELRKIMNELIELDTNAKRGKIDLELGLKSILCNYCS